jgi:hypothetical protein
VGIPEGDRGRQGAWAGSTRGVRRWQRGRRLVGGGGLDFADGFSFVYFIFFLCSGGLEGGEGATVDVFGAVDRIWTGT